MESKIIYILLTLFAGIAVTMQGPMNSALGKSLRNPNLATYWSFLFGTILITIYLIAKRTPIPSVEMLKATPWWAYIGAITGIIYVSTLVLVIPKLGAGTTTVLLILAQIITALVLDKYGLFGLDIKDINISKIIGVVLMIFGVVLVSK